MHHSRILCDTFAACIVVYVALNASLIKLVGIDMNGIEKILTHIKSECHAECEAIKRAADEECGRIRAKYARMEQDEYRKLMDTGKKEVERRLQRLNSLAALESKKHVLMTQQEMLAKAFEHAAQKLLDLPESDYVNFLASQACAASLSGMESIILSPYDRKRVGNETVKAANSALRAARKNASLTLSDRTADIRGGLILSSGDIEVNCSVDALVAAHRNELSPYVASVLFD